MLNAAGVRYALIGDYAIAAHGYNRFSEDLDQLVEPSAENTGKWIVRPREQRQCLRRVRHRREVVAR